MGESTSLKCERKCVIDIASSLVDWKAVEQSRGHRCLMVRGREMEPVDCGCVVE